MNEPEIVNLVADLIARLGFPIFVAVWMLWRDQKRMDHLVSTLWELKKAIEILTIMIDGTATYRATESGQDIVRIQQ